MVPRKWSIVEILFSGLGPKERGCPVREVVNDEIAHVLQCRSQDTRWQKIYKRHQEFWVELHLG